MSVLRSLHIEYKRNLKYKRDIEYKRSRDPFCRITAPQGYGILLSGMELLFTFYQKIASGCDGGASRDPYSADIHQQSYDKRYYSYYKECPPAFIKKLRIVPARIDRNQFIHKSVSHNQRGQKPMKSIVERAREDVPVAT